MGTLSGEAFDPELFVRDRFQNVTELFQEFHAGRFHLCLAGIEQDAVTNLSYGDIALGNFILQ